MALVAALVLQWLSQGADSRHLGYFVVERWRMLGLDALLIWSVLISLWAVTARLAVASGLVVTAAVVTGFASYAKLQATSEPLYPVDLAFADNTGFLADMVSGTTLAALAIAVLAVMTIALLVARIASPEQRRDRTAWTILGRVFAVVVSMALVWQAVGFNRPHNLVRAAFDRSGAVWQPSNQIQNYAQNGFLGGFLYNLDSAIMDVPPGYDRTAVEAIVKRYTAAAAITNAGRDDARMRRTNVVVILDEAFSDPTRLTGFELERDPLPFTRRLLEQVPSGQMLAQKYGTGTANMEFEAMTGQSTAIFDTQSDTPFQMLLPDYETYPSLARYFRSIGHRAVALHPYDPSMYQRQTVYPILGFEEFISEKDLTYTQRLDDNPFVSDHASFQQVIHEIERSSDPLLLNVVTMQNHYDYEDLYRDPLVVEGVPTREAARIGTYARGLEHTDDAIKDLLADVTDLDEPCLLIFYGDHLPGVYDSDVLIANGRRAMHETPLFLWSNDIDLPAQTLPTTSPVQVIPMAFDLLDAPIPPYLALLDRLRDEVPGLSADLMIGPDDRTIDEASLTDEARRVLADLRMIQYDLSVGRRWSEQAMFAPPAG